MDQQGRSRGRKRSAPPEADPEIPDKLYFRIGEAARLLALPTYVLRFWESEFPQLRPSKGGTGQRLYRKRDVEMALRIKRLLYAEGYTIPGARQLLKGEQREAEPRDPAPAAAEIPAPTVPEPAQTRLRRMRAELAELAGMLAAAPAKPATRAAPRETATPRRGLHLARRESPGELGRSRGLEVLPFPPSDPSNVSED